MPETQQNRAFPLWHAGCGRSHAGTPRGPGKVQDDTMQTASTVALSRLVAQQRALDVVATNVANQGTPGFQAQHALFSDWLNRQARTEPPPGGRTVSYVQDRATYRDQQAGPIEHTGNPLDLALNGGGYFTVDTPGGVRLTRAGRFGLTADGTIADAQGNNLLDANGQPLRVAVTDRSITVTADGAVSTENGQVGKVAVVRPNDPNRLKAEGDRLLRADEGTQPVDRPRVVQGAVEGSNVKPVQEMTRMMDALREFQFASQFVQAEGERQMKAVDTLLKRGA